MKVIKQRNMKAKLTLIVLHRRIHFCHPQRVIIANNTIWMISSWRFVASWNIEIPHNTNCRDIWLNSSSERAFNTFKSVPLPPGFRKESPNRELCGMHPQNKRVKNITQYWYHVCIYFYFDNAFHDIFQCCMKIIGFNYYLNTFRMDLQCITVSYKNCRWWWKL